jgi:hypothetical protein
MKQLLSFTMIAAMIMLAIGACKDDFNENDFLRDQQALVDSASEQATKEFIKAANEAGDLLAVTLMARENGIPVQGVTVTLTSSSAIAISSGRTKAEQTGLTDVTGNVIFERVTIGAGIITFRKTGYVGSSAKVDFGEPSVPIEIPATENSPKKFLPPTKRSESAIIPMYSATPNSASTATITGKATIENDVTNTTQEVPAGVVIRADLTALVTLPVNDFISDFAFEDNTSLGVATVAANGTYIMTVPATAAGLNIGLIIPNIEGTSRMAVSGYDNGTGQITTLTNGPEYRDVPTSWGPQASVGFGNIVPEVAGAKLVFPPAPPVGTGLTFDVAPVPQAIGGGIISSAATQEINGAYYKINKRGNYSAGPNPTVTIKGGGGLGAKAFVSMRTYVSAITINNVGAGYIGNASINIVRVRDNDTEVEESNIIVPTIGGKLPSTIDLASFAGATGFTASNPILLFPNLKALKMTVTGGGVGAQVTGTFRTELHELQVQSGGAGYTGIFTFEFNGGGLADGSPDHASVAAVDFPVQWTITPNNSNASDYSVLPTFSVSYPPSPLGLINNDSDVEVWSVSGVSEGTSSLTSRLTISSGDVVQKEAARILKTIKQSGRPPSVTMSSLFSVNARRTLTAANIHPVEGYITSIPNGDALTNGMGYNFPITMSFQPAIAGAPGGGAVFTLTNIFDVNSLEYNWEGGFSVESIGSGYLQNLNRKPVETGVFPTIISAQPGKTYIAHIHYGTGNRQVNVN